MTRQWTSYEDYLQSDVWRKLRTQVRRRVRRRCEVCGRKVSYPRDCRYYEPHPPALEVHHIRYAHRWGEESLDDLIGLCSPCHERIHEILLTEPDGERALAQLRGEDQRALAILVEIGLEA